MKRFLTLILAALAPCAFSGLYVCKSQAMTHTDTCVIQDDCPGNCKICTWSRGYCGMSVGNCYTRSAKNGGVATVQVEERKCTLTYGCACDRADLMGNPCYVGKVDQCGSSPFNGSTIGVGEEDADTNTGPAPTPAQP